MTRNQIRNQLYHLERDGRIDRWKEEQGPSGYIGFYIQVDNEDEWILYYDEEDL